MIKSSFNLSHFTFVLCLIIILTTCSGCRKEGTGGKSSVSGSVFHHSQPIANAIVYIKYGAKEFPGADVSVYDDHTTVDANAKYEFSNLRKGDYFLYGVGYDNAIFLPVTGGIPVKLKYNKSESTDVPVTE